MFVWYFLAYYVQCVHAVYVTLYKVEQYGHHHHVCVCVYKVEQCVHHDHVCVCVYKVDLYV